MKLNKNQRKVKIARLHQATMVPGLFGTTTDLGDTQKIGAPKYKIEMAWDGATLECETVDKNKKTWTFAFPAASIAMILFDENLDLTSEKT